MTEQEMNSRYKISAVWSDPGNRQQAIILNRWTGDKLGPEDAAEDRGLDGSVQSASFLEVREEVFGRFVLPRLLIVVGDVDSIYSREAVLSARGDVVGREDRSRVICSEVFSGDVEEVFS